MTTSSSGVPVDPVPESSQGFTSAITNREVRNRWQLQYGPESGLKPSVFISCASADFESHRKALADLLPTQDAAPVWQEKFRQLGGDLLEKLHEAVRNSAVVIHLIGENVGYKEPIPAERIGLVVEAISGKLHGVLPDFSRLTFTQWEAVLAIAYRKPLLIYIPEGTRLKIDPNAEMPLSGGEWNEAQELASQQNHLCWLLKQTHDVGKPGSFRDAEKLLMVAVLDLGSVLAEARLKHRQNREKEKQTSLHKSFGKQSPVAETTHYLNGRKLAHVTVHGRDWLQKDIKQWLSDGDKKIFWLQADAGFGKSSFCSKLALGWNGDTSVTVAAQVYCNPSMGPFEVLRQICCQLRSTVPNYQDKFDDLWNQIPWNKIEIPEELDQEGPEQDEFTDKLVGPLLIDPLRRETSHTGLDYLIVIDGLDEVLQRREGASENPLQGLLQRLFDAALPCVRFLVTSRPSKHYQQLDDLIGTRQPHDCEPTRDQEETDARLFIKGELGDDWCADHVLSVVLTKSKLSMLYLHYLAYEIRKGKLAPDRLGELPDGLGRYYLAKLREYFPGASGLNLYQSRVSPCLAAIAAGERTDVTVADLETCFGADTIREFRESMHAMIIERQIETRNTGDQAMFLVQRNKKIEGRMAQVFAPFHLSFMDWLVGRNYDEDHQHDPRHMFRVHAEEGDRILSKWAWREFESRKNDAKSVPNPGDYWIRQGVDHQIQTFLHLHKGELNVTSAASPYERFTYIEQAVELLAWLNKFGATEVIVSRCLSLLTNALGLTIEDDEALTHHELAAMEPVDQFKLFDLVKDICATDTTDEVIGWIGRTQRDADKWNVLVEKMLDLQEFVIRAAAASGQAARYRRLITDIRPGETLESERALANQEIDNLLSSPNANRQEMGSYAVGDIAKEWIPKVGIEIHVAGWLENLAELDYYFCQSVLGDILIEFSLSHNYSEIEELDDADLLTPFWNPIWQYTRQDVARVLALSMHHRQELSKHLQDFKAEAKQELEAIEAREKRIVEFSRNENGRIPDSFNLKESSDSLAEAREWGVHLAKVVQKPDLGEPDRDLVCAWFTRTGVTTEVRIRSMVDFLRLMFSHTAWRVGEGGASLVPTLEAHTRDREACLRILDQLIDALDPTDPSQGRIILGTAEACYLSRHFDQGRVFDGKRMSRLEYCIRTFYDHPNCDVRGLLVENVVFLIGKHDRERSVWKMDRSQMKVLQELEPQIDYWLLDPDIWVLEHVYQLFTSFARKPDTTITRPNWIDARMKHVQAHPDCLLAKISAATGQDWRTLDRSTFLKTAQRLQREHPYKP